MPNTVLDFGATEVCKKTKHPFPPKIYFLLEKMHNKQGKYVKYS